MTSHSIITFNSPSLPYLVEAGMRLFEPGEHHPNRRNLGVFDLIFVTQGKLWIGEAEQQWEVSTGQMLILLPDRAHYSVEPFEEATFIYWLHFQSAEAWVQHEDLSSLDLKQERSYQISLPKYWNSPFPDQISEIMKRLLQLSTHSRSQSFWLQQQLFIEFMRIIEEDQHEREASPAFMIAEKVEAFIKQNYQHELTNNRLAEELHFHANYIARCMKQVYHQTPMEYLVQYRLEQAKLLLLKTDWSVARIAEEVGFQFAPYFSKCFRKRYATSPLQFRKHYA